MNNGADLQQLCQYDFDLSLSANVLHSDRKRGSRVGGNLTTLQEVFSRIVQDVTSDNFSMGGTSLTPFECTIAKSSTEGITVHVLQA